MTEGQEVDIQKLQEKEKVAKVPKELIEENMDIIEATAAKVTKEKKLPPGIEFNDLVSWGIEGLVKAKQKYEDEKGVQFSTYAYFRIRGEILDRIRSEWRYRYPKGYQSSKEKLKGQIAEYADSFIDDHEGSVKSAKELAKELIENTSMSYLLQLDNQDVESVSEGLVNPEIEFIDQDTSEFWKEIDRLDPLEKKFVDLFYRQGYKQKEIAKMENLSSSKICRMHTKILKKLKVRLKEFNTE